MKTIYKCCLIIAILQSVFWSWDLGFIGFLKPFEIPFGKFKYIGMVILSFSFLLFCVFAVMSFFKRFKNLNKLCVIWFVINVVFLNIIPNHSILFEIPTYIALTPFVDTNFAYFLCFFFYKLLNLFTLFLILAFVIVSIKERLTTSEKDIGTSNQETDGL